MSFPRSLLLMVVAALPLSAAAANLEVTVGTKVIALAIPGWMQDVAQRSVVVRRVLEAGIPGELRLLACFLPVADAGILDAGRATRLDRHIMAVTYRADEDHDKSAAQFASFQQVTDESLARKRGTPLASEVIERGENYYSYAGVRDRSANEATGEPARKLAIATLVVRIQKRQVSYFIYANYRDARDLEWTRSVSVALRKALRI
jgi:hypothetical protein